MSLDSGDAINATVRRWQLTASLRQLREEAGLTMTQVADQLREAPGKWSRSKLQRIETREQGIKTKEIEQLLDLYQVTDADVRATVLDLGATAQERGYWLAIRKDLPEDFHSVLDVEAALLSQRQFETMVIPGLLQTADYARALMIGGRPGVARDVVERRVLARMSRQQVLTKPNPLRLHAIVEEGILERPVGTVAVMREQLRRLLTNAEADHITIQVLPKSAGASPALDGPFSILSLPDPIPDFGYSEGTGRAVYIEDRDAVREYTLNYGILTGLALSPERSSELIEEAVQRFG
jgi:transcriptional regulator with XRE-family HTH domain